MVLVSSVPSPQFILKSGYPLLPFIVSKSIVSPTLDTKTSKTNSGLSTTAPGLIGV